MKTNQKEFFGETDPDPDLGEEAAILVCAPACSPPQLEPCWPPELPSDALRDSDHRQGLADLARVVAGLVVAVPGPGLEVAFTIADVLLAHPVSQPPQSISTVPVPMLDHVAPITGLVLASR